MDKWVTQLKLERQGITPKAAPLTPEHPVSTNGKAFFTRILCHFPITMILTTLFKLQLHSTIHVQRFCSYHLRWPF
ncbi:hypothetical protein GGC03_25195 (plasmid) [Vibrio sp. THAF191c]|nr:hypothetical protein FIU99_25510 [Vibrio sp. THAF64]QGM37746.1 hypothetical protein GGC04_25970 [Vibrio sp. THAF191d]QGN73089.1 hypothetical protein GGC03_25195 [Vibrio sp. THAF191c]